MGSKGKKKTFRPLADFLADQGDEQLAAETEKPKALDHEQDRLRTPPEDLLGDLLRAVVAEEQEWFTLSPEELLREEQRNFEIYGYRSVERSYSKELPRGILVDAIEFAELFVVNNPGCIGQSDFRKTFDIFFEQYMLKKFHFPDTVTNLATLRVWFEEQKKIHERPWRFRSWQVINNATYENCLKALLHVRFIQKKRGAIVWLINTEFIKTYNPPHYQKFGTKARREEEWDDFDNFDW